MGHLLKFKDTIPGYLRSNLIYKISCNDCDNEYIGCTTRSISKRIEEHESCNHSSVYKHMTQLNHTINYHNVKVLDYASNEHELLLKEMLYINKFKPKMNVQVKSELFNLLINKFIN